ncbi:hypothetical protein NBRC116591_04860 [Sessilibacter corallicola]|uniref:Phage protein n=1 Tax=Sessilibacter corallicola TaxID=2904075 RepID=A0ABQ0A4W7_9GAMM
MDENTLIARFVIPALISAVISLIVAITTSIIQTKNNNKSIEAASKRLEETHKYQLERDEENRNHQLKMIETQFTREHRINRKNRRTDFIYSEKNFSQINTKNFLY